MNFPSELEVWNGCSVAEWRALWGLPALHILGLTGSTNDDVRRLAEQGAPELTVVIANQQSAGRGQHGRSWSGLPGKSLHLSALLRPASLHCLPAAPVKIGLQIAKQLARFGVQVRLKWPNDLVVRARKLGGILCEGVAGPQTFIVAGIGINVGHEQEDFPPELADSATSLLIEDRGAAVPDIAGAVIEALRAVAPLMGKPLGPTELAELTRRDALRDRPISINGVPAGHARGIEQDGSLRVEQHGGIRLVRTGTVRVVADD